MELKDLLPGIIGSFVGVMGWLLVGLYIQRRQFVRQARNAAKAVYFELDVNLTAVLVAHDHGSFVDLDRSSFERLLPELATLLAAQDLEAVVGAYMTHAGYRQLAGSDDLPAEVRRPALEAIARAHERALETLRSRAFTSNEAKGRSRSTGKHRTGGRRTDREDGIVTDDEPQWIVHGWARVVRSHDWDAFARARSVLAPDFDPSDWRGPYRDLSRDVPRGTS